MLTYTRLSNAALQGKIDLSNPRDVEEVSAYLTDQWIDDYAKFHRAHDIVEVRTDEFKNQNDIKSGRPFKNLFDIKGERLIAAWGQSHGRASQIRNRSRMAGHPLGGPTGYHRGHAIPHTLGGGLDINLVPQKGSVNVGPFRELERMAVATPGALYFTYWIYAAGPSQRPSGVQQGFIKPGGPLELRQHAN